MHEQNPHVSLRNTESHFLLVNANEIEGKISTSPKVEFLPSISICGEYQLRQRGHQSNSVNAWTQKRKGKKGWWEAKIKLKI
jgi:hypothetical protein